jgi:hypothetical protein
MSGYALSGAFSSGILCTMQLLKRKYISIPLAIAVVLGVLYAFGTYTYSGRVSGLYVFGGFFAPVGVKYECTKESLALVEEKFMLPLDFDALSKQQLREFWHFSYYRACLFRAGYDFGGNVIAPSELTPSTDSLHYRNYFAGIDMKVPNGTIISVDNITNPDIEDRLIASQLLVNGATVYVYAYRSYDDADTYDALALSFTHFATSTGEIVGGKVPADTPTVRAFTATDSTGLSGFVTRSPKGRVIQVFGENMSSETITQLLSSLSFIE